MGLSLTRSFRKLLFYGLPVVESIHPFPAATVIDAESASVSNGRTYTG